MEALGFFFFAGNVAVSHGYAHLVEFDTRIDVGGLPVSPGDLIYGDSHGVVSIPHGIAAEVPSVAARLLDQERCILDLCQSPDFSIEKLRAAVAVPRPACFSTDGGGPGGNPWSLGYWHQCSQTMIAAVLPGERYGLRLQKLSDTDWRCGLGSLKEAAQTQSLPPARLVGRSSVNGL